MILDLKKVQVIVNIVHDAAGTVKIYTNSSCQNVIRTITLQDPVADLDKLLLVELENWFLKMICF